MNARRRKENKIKLHQNLCINYGTSLDERHTWLSNSGKMGSSLLAESTSRNSEK